jgi:hypothetical protein
VTTPHSSPFLRSSLFVLSPDPHRQAYHTPNPHLHVIVELLPRVHQAAISPPPNHWGCCQGRGEATAHSLLWRFGKVATEGVTRSRGSRDYTGEDSDFSFRFSFGIALFHSNFEALLSLLQNLFFSKHSLTLSWSLSLS